MGLPRAILVLGVVQLVAVTTLTSPSPVRESRDGFVEELEALKAIIDDAIAGKTDTDDDILGDDLVDELRDQLVVTVKDDPGESVVNDLMEFGYHNDADDEKDILNFDEIDKVIPTSMPDVIQGVDVDGIDELVDELKMLVDKLNDTSKNTPQDKTLISDAKPRPTDAPTASDEVVDELENQEIVDEILTEVVTDIVEVTEGPYTNNLATDIDGDYELITDVTMVTEIIYDVIHEDVNDDDDPFKMEQPLGTGTQMTEMGTPATGIPLSMNAQNQRERFDFPLDVSTVEIDQASLLVTEVVTEYQTDVELGFDPLASELRDLARSGDEGQERISTTSMDSDLAVATTPSDNRELEMELDELVAVTDADDEDDEPTFVFSTPYPTILGSTEVPEVGPDMQTAKPSTDRKCSGGRYACADGSQCVLPDTVCDTMFDCPDGSDESQDICKPDRQCPTGFIKCGRSFQCIRDTDLCDGIFHCYNGADEKSCLTCIGSHGDRKYLEIEDFCDGVQDCDDNTDETSERCTNPCPDGFSKCADGLQCVKDELFCNAFTNCRDGSDEGNHCDRSQRDCEAFGMFACDGICMIKSALCDETPDCRSGIDERGCTAEFYSCPDEFTLNKVKGVCVHNSLKTP
ncbi:uncharacterized protein [Diadema antillarum]|uniref:uncharacterized protein n=1 Tax=Diadema antillarum TaxID=105358 RepID=UPI003A87355F